MFTFFIIAVLFSGVVIFFGEFFLKEETRDMINGLYWVFVLGIWAVMWTMFSYQGACWSYNKGDGFGFSLLFFVITETIFVVIPIIGGSIWGNLFGKISNFLK